MKHIIVGIDPWEVDLYPDLTSAAHKIGVSRTTLHRLIRKTGSCMVNRFYIKQVDDPKSASGGKTSGSLTRADARLIKQSKSPQNNEYSDE